ncbi:MAG: beta-ketoacyl-[acyl-carrier-protein] synthase family protein [Flavobacteriales bacterium]|nr:beta-ketoacyl-[acyl-carrier-protein] synthase family protein [Flavobacteriales bacterium]MCX7648995.1 beta-ketoacyl-[acyl-carrier-protein] synthase family protein [Flavobacteriales bacterium]MDW8431720.1 beta-ketoacyl-[acyl-carrier-protein] synthase family protein [Flavobacteriales bacterium]
MRHRVVVTGIGIYSCIGLGVEEVTQALFAGKSGIVFDPERKAMGFRSALTGKVPPANLKGLVERRARVCMAEEAEYAYISTMEALKMAGLDQDFLDQHIVGIIFGNDSSARAVVEGCDIMRAKKDTTLMGSGYVFQAMNSTVTMNLATILRLKGINFTVSGACASGSHAVGLAYMMIAQGLQDIVISGGAQEVNPWAFGSFDALGAFSTREEAPQKASRPFDKNRDGLVPSGGSATLILENLESARRRGAKILAEVVGYGFSSNGDHISQPNVEGPKRSILMALEQAGLSPREIDYVNAHATSTPVGDENEARAILEVFGDNSVPVTSTKSMTGHECWMAGASELVYCILMMQNDFIAPNINLEEPDTYASRLHIPTKALNAQLNCILSNSFGFGGTNSTIILKKV